MNLAPPSIPEFSVPALEDPDFAPRSLIGISGQPNQEPGLRLRFNPAWFQFLQKTRQAMLAFPAALFGTSKAGSVTLNAANGVVTTEALTTAAGARYTLTMLNNTVTADSNVIVTVSNATNAQGAALLQGVTPEAGKVLVDVLNVGAQPFNGSLQINFLVF